MAAVKFFMEFENVQGDLCTVNFIYEDYNDAPIRLYGGPQPFVLGEFNTDDDLYKPMRPQQATIQVLASAGGVSIEDFLPENDEDVTVRFDFGDYGGYWQGYLSLEDMEEIWISTNHILTLRADEGFGRMKQTQLNDGTGTALAGPHDMFNLIQYAADDVVGNFFYTRIYSNLLNTAMTTTSNQTGLDQAYVNVRTFEKAPNDFEDSYTVLEKINKAWSQTLFQWNSLWIILRIPELFRTGNLVGFNTNRPTVGNRQAVNKRYDIEVGVTARFYRLRETGGNTLALRELYFGDNSTELPMARLNRDDYTNLPNKYFQSNRPLQYWYDRLIPNPVMHLWPVPNSGADTSQLVLWVQRYIMDVGTMTQQIEVPQRWYEAIVAMLAAKMALEITEVDVNLIGLLDAKADKALYTAQAEERDNSPMMIAPNIAMYTR